MTARQQLRSKGWALASLIVAVLGLGFAMTSPAIFPAWLETLCAAAWGFMISDSLNVLAGDA